MYNSASYRCKGRQCWPGVPSCLPITDRDPDDEPFLGRARSLDQPRGARTMASFAYVFDRRLAKTVIGAATQFLYDGPNIAQQVERQRTTSYLCHRQAGKMTASLVCTSIGRATTLGSDGSSARIGFARLERAPVESEGEPGVRSTAMVGAAVALLATHPVSRAPLEIHVREDPNAAWRERVREVRKEFVGGCDD